jgi:hypothetical protein
MDNAPRRRPNMEAAVNPTTLLDYANIKSLAAELNRPAKTLLAMTPGNDPFAIVAYRRAAAEWFADLWQRHGGAGVHVRRLHYAIISQSKPVKMPDGRPYRNTRICWEWFIRASGDARFLDLIPAEDFVDRRNDDPLIHVSDNSSRAFISILARDPSTEIAQQEMPDLPELHLYRPTILQRYHIEIWCEKTTVNDVLQPLAREYGLNVVTGSGELSQTACVNVVERALQSDRPVRILYISDFDPAGQHMPVSVARKIEHRLYLKNLDLDIQVRPIALTYDQCGEYRLPRTPLKVDPRIDSFVERYGEGATELDALQALHPGELHNIIVSEINRYYDDDLDDAVDDIASEIEASFSKITRKVHAAHKAEITKLETEWKRIAKEYVRQIAAWQKRAKPVWHAYTNDLQAQAPDPDLIDWPEPADGDEDDDPLFDSTRDYVEQIDRYKAFQDKPTKRRNGAGRP